MSEAKTRTINPQTVEATRQKKLAQARYISGLVDEDAKKRTPELASAGTDEAYVTLSAILAEKKLWRDLVAELEAAAPKPVETPKAPQTTAPKPK